MKIAGALREQLGLTQQALAAFIDMRTALARAESGDAASQPVLLRCWQPFTNMPKLSAKAAGENAGSFRRVFKEALQLRAEECRSRCYACKKARAATGPRRNGQKVAVYPGPAAAGGAHPCQKAKTLAGEQTYQAGRKLEACGDEAQIRLELRLAAMQAELGICERAGKLVVSKIHSPEGSIKI